MLRTDTKQGVCDMDRKVLVLALAFAILIMNPILNTITTNMVPDKKTKTMVHETYEYSKFTRDTTNKIRLYLRGGNNNYYLDTVPPTSSNVNNLILDDSTTTPPPSSVTFKANYTFSQKVEIFGEELPAYEDRKGVWLHLPTNFVGVGSATVKINLLSVIGSTSHVVASGTSTVSPGVSENNYQLAFENPADSFMYESGSLLSLEISVNITGTGTVRFGYNSTSASGNAYLSLRTDFVSAIDGEVYDWQDAIGYVFEPNLPLMDKEGNKIRVIKIKGNAIDVFHQSDIKAVGIEVRDPSNNIIQPYVRASVIMDANNLNRVAFEYIWEYPKGLTPGDGYKITVVVTDRSGNNYTKDMYFSIAEYGVFVDSDSKSYAIQPDTSLKVVIYVYNSGSKQDTIKTDVSVKDTVPDGADWNVVMVVGNDEKSSDEKTLSKGSYQSYELKVTSPSGSKAGNRCTIKILSSSTKATDVTYTLNLEFTVVPKTEFLFNVMGDDTVTIAPGTMVEFEFSVKNIGEVNDTYTVALLNMNILSNDWDVDFYTTVVDIDWTKNTTTNGLAYDFNLTPNKEAKINLKVTLVEGASPSQASQDFEVAVTSHSAPTNIKTRTFTVLIEGAVGDIIKLEKNSVTIGVKTTMEDTIKYETASLYLYIDNPTSRDLTGTINEISKPDGWTLQYQNNFNLAAGSGKNSFEIKITPKDNEEANATVGYKISLKVTITELGKSDSVTITAYIPEYENISAELITDRNATATDVNGATFRIKIKNNGNTGISIYLYSFIEVDKSDYWKVRFDENPPIYLNMGEAKTIKVTIKPVEELLEIGDRVHVDITIKYGTAKRSIDIKDLTITYMPETEKAIIKVSKDLMIPIILFIILLIYAIGVGSKLKT